MFSGTSMRILINVTGQCYDTLQKEYDELLQKYAQAENTIDKLRIETLREKIEQCKEQKGNKDFIEQYNKVCLSIISLLLFVQNRPILFIFLDDSLKTSIFTISHKPY